MPTYFIIFCGSFGINTDFHAVVEKTIGLRVIQDVELDSVISLSIHHPKEKPLSVALRVHIILHE